jgi:endonuclease YncB( thermonuclease family)
VRLLLAALLLIAAEAAAFPYGPHAATVVRVIDGDTVEVDVTPWPHANIRATVRLAGIDTPELSGAPCEAKLARAARKAAQDWLAGRDVRVTLTGRDKYGRFVGRLTDDRGGDLSDALLAAGHGRPYAGGKRGAWCR